MPRLRDFRFAPTRHLVPGLLFFLNQNVWWFQRRKTPLLRKHQHSVVKSHFKVFDVLPHDGKKITLSRHIPARVKNNAVDLQPF